MSRAARYEELVRCNDEVRIMRKSSDDSDAATRGLATLDYVLVLGVILPLAAFLFRVGPMIIRLAYEMVCALVSWPFM